MQINKLQLSNSHPVSWKDVLLNVSQQLVKASSTSSQHKPHMEAVGGTAVYSAQITSSPAGKAAVTERSLVNCSPFNLAYFYSYFIQSCELLMAPSHTALCPQFHSFISCLRAEGDSSLLSFSDRNACSATRALV